MKAFLLAAGNGRRAGGPKAWLEHEGRPLLKRQLQFLLARLRPEDVLVSIQGAWLARCAALNDAVRWVEADPDKPAFDSLLRLIEAAGPGDWASVHHVDMPVWEPALFDALWRRAERTSALAVAPRLGGRRGHPVLLSARAQAELLAGDPERDRLDAWLRSRDVEDVDLPFSCIAENWNEGVGRE